MNHLRTVQTRNVVVSNVMMSNAPKMTCPGDPRAQTHTQIVRAYLRYSPDTCLRKCMDKRRRGVPAVAADFSIHLYMHKNTNKRQHA